jgi:hypothetical protein
MSLEFLLLSIAGGITLIAYMIAINAQGPIRLIVSYFLATILLAGTVYLIIQHVNALEEVKRRQALLVEYRQSIKIDTLSKIDSPKNQIQLSMNFLPKVNQIVTAGINCAIKMNTVDFQDKRVDFETLMARAVEMKKKTDELSFLAKKNDSIALYYPEVAVLIKDAIRLLNDASAEYSTYYYAEDSNQEQQKESLIRFKSKNALDKFRKAEVLSEKNKSEIK